MLLLCISLNRAMQSPRNYCQAFVYTFVCLFLSKKSLCFSCRLIALSKNPGVRPISIGVAVRRIVHKAILTVTKGDVQDAVGTRQLCAGPLLSGIEYM